MSSRKFPSASLVEHLARRLARTLERRFAGRLTLERLTELAQQARLTTDEENERAWLAFNARRQRRTLLRYANGPGMACMDLASRPAAIVVHYMRHLRKQRHWTWAEVRDYFTSRTSISKDDLARMERGEPPTGSQLDRICRAFELSLYFMFGISEQSYQEQEAAFFRKMGYEDFGPRERQEFRALYERLLKLKLKLNEQPKKEEGP